jgi:hypothetical protein
MFQVQLSFVVNLLNVFLVWFAEFIITIIIMTAAGRKNDYLGGSQTLFSRPPGKGRLFEGQRYAEFRTTMERLHFGKTSLFWKACTRSLLCNVDAEYRRRICSRTKGNHGRS